MNQPATIIIVDDVAANRETLVALLEAPDVRLIEAPNGAEALRLAAESPPDLILLDIMMPGMDGFEVCRRLRADAGLAEVPVIMVTALDDKVSRLAGLEAGADDFVSKPFNRAELRARVRTITRLNRYRRLHEQRRQFQWIVEQATDGFVMVNATDEILYANARARLWLGLPAADEAGRAPARFLATASRIFTGQPAELWQGWPAVPPDTLSHRRLLVRPESRQARAFFLEVSIDENSAGRLLRLHDATERLTTQQDQRSFQTTISHKLRTPLNGLNGGLELLTDAANLSPEEITEYVAMAQEETTRLTAVIEDVLRFAELSKLPAADAPFRLSGLEEMVQGIAARLSLPAVSVAVDAKSSASSIACRPETMEWVLSELLGNAKKFHPRHAPAVEVSAHLTGTSEAILAVTDDGVTLSPEQLARAGQPFFQGEKRFTGETPGMGLGLASVTTALWQTGGICHVRNRQSGPGVCVQLTVPCVRPESIAGT